MPMPTMSTMPGASSEFVHCPSKRASAELLCVRLKDSVVIQAWGVWPQAAFTPGFMDAGFLAAGFFGGSNFNVRPSAS